MEAIRNTVDSVMQALKAGKTASGDARIEDALKKVLTKKELKHIKVNYFKKGILGIRVDSSGWLYSLSIKKENLCNSLHKEYSGLKDVRFSLGDIA